MHPIILIWKERSKGKRKIEKCLKLPGKRKFRLESEKIVWELKMRKWRENSARGKRSVEYKIFPPKKSAFSRGLGSFMNNILSKPPASQTEFLQRNRPLWTCCENSPCQKKRHKDLVKKWIKGFMSRLHNSHPKNHASERKRKIGKWSEKFFLCRKRVSVLSSVPKKLEDTSWSRKFFWHICRWKRKADYLRFSILCTRHSP